MKYNRLRRSFSARLSLYTILIVEFALIGTFSFIFYNFYQSVNDNAFQETKLTIEKACNKIENKLLAVSKSVDNIKYIIQEENLPPDSLYSTLLNFVANNDEIIGSAIAFEPNHFPDKGHFFSPYVAQKDGQLITKQLGTKDYNYFISEWYQIPKLLGRNYWSEPYFDDGGADEYICTYSSVMTNSAGEFIGIVTADISLDWLNDLMKNIQLYPHSYTFVLGTSGMYIVHTSKDLVFNETIFSGSYTAIHPEYVREIGQRMVDGEKGVSEYYYQDKKSYISYAPIQQMGWSVAVVNTFEDIFAGLKILTIKSLIYFAGAIILIFICCRWVIRKNSKPLEEFAASAKKIAHGDFNASLPKIKTKDEMMTLKQSLEYMKTELVHYIDSLQHTVSAKERIESELRIARNIQMGMVPSKFPPFPERKDIDIYAFLRPAKGVGGDLYDYFINDEKLFFTIGDVSGKGIPASLCMAVTRSLFRSTTVEHDQPKKIIELINSIIAENNEENMFVTLFIGVLNLKTGQLHFCNAGHNPPCLKDRDGNVSFMKIKKNLPVGLFDDFDYEAEEITLKKGETIFLYTDGLTEAENAAEKLYSEELLLKTLSGKPRYDAENLLKQVLNSVSEHVKDAPQSDDLAMVVIRYLDEKNEQNIKQLIIKNQIEELKKLPLFIETIGEQEGFSPVLTMNLNLALEEAISNVILYGFPNDKEPHNIELDFERNGSELTFTLKDDGIDFDPTAKKDADISLSAQERQIGGLGIFMVKQIMTSIAHRREGDFNIFTMKKMID